MSGLPPAGPERRERIPIELRGEAGVAVVAPSPRARAAVLPDSAVRRKLGELDAPEMAFGA